MPEPAGIHVAAPSRDRFDEVLTPKALDFLGTLHREFDARRRELGDRKAAAVAATGEDVLVTANPGCLMQIASAMRRSGGAIALAHTAEILDASIRAASIRGAPSRRAPSSQGE